MGITRYYLKENNFMVSRLSGEINEQNLKEHILAFNEETKEMPPLRELADCRGIENLEELTVVGTVRCSEIVDCHPDNITAILVNDSTLLYGMARTYQMFQDEKRKSVEIFTDLDEALSWLANDEKEIEVLKKFIENGMGSGVGPG